MPYICPVPDGALACGPMNPPYRYIGFGLKIASEIEFPELFPGGTGEADVLIRLGIPDETLFLDHDKGKVWYEFLPERFRLNIPDAGRYLATAGDTIRFEKAPDAEMATARIYVLSLTMAGLLMQRGSFLLHASGIVHGGGVHLFMGESGSGKSSLLGELRRRGYRAFTDDVCVLSSGADGRVLALASYPMMKLLPESIRQIDDDRYGFGHRIWPDEEKYGQFFHEEFVYEGLPIGSIHILNPDDNHRGGYRREEVKGVEAFKVLTEHTYRKQFIREVGLASRHATLVTRLLSQAPVRIVTRPMTGSDIRSFSDFMADAIERH